VDHPLRSVLVEAVRGRFPDPDGSVELMPPWLDGVEGVVALTGRAYVATARSADAVMAWRPDGFGAALEPRFIAWLAGPHGWCDCLDVLLAAEGTGAGGPPPRPGDGDRVRHAQLVRSDVEAFGDSRGVITLGTGVAGLWEIGVEVVAAARGTGVGRSLIADARGLVATGEPVLAAVAPGNAASLRAFLAAGFQPIGSVQLVRPEGRPDERG
jgi:GNAT superfamily N-acetyltransferase